MKLMGHDFSQTGYTCHCVNCGIRIYSAMPVLFHCPTARRRKRIGRIVLSTRRRLWMENPNRPTIPARWDRLPGTHQVGFQDQRGKTRNRPALSKKEANATPLEFALFLIGLAQVPSHP